MSDFIILFFVGIPLYIFLSWGWDKLYPYQYFIHKRYGVAYSYHLKDKIRTDYYHPSFKETYFVDLDGFQEVDKEEFNKTILTWKLMK